MTPIHKKVFELSLNNEIEFEKILHCELFLLASSHFLSQFPDDIHAVDLYNDLNDAACDEIDEKEVNTKYNISLVHGNTWDETLGNIEYLTKELIVLVDLAKKL
jgi:hypothetical protein